MPESIVAALGDVFERWDGKGHPHAKRDDDSALFCVSSPEVNSCAVLVEGDQLYQLEARVGVVARF